MAIKFQCPHCKKSLNVRDQLAGKRAACPGCKQSITIPANEAAVPSPEMEDLAAAALADEPVARGVPKTVDFKCYYCDEELHIDVALAGKQTPCPECGRIIKVPVPAKVAEEDW